jgi:hypothetical protein
MEAMKRTLVLAFLVPSLALAHSVSEELTVNGTRATEQNPQTGSASNRISGNFELNDTWAMHADLTLTHVTATPPANGGVFPDTGGNVLDVGLGLEWDATEHWNFALDVNLSPSSETTNNTSIDYEGPLGGTTSADANLKTTASSSGLNVSGSWSTLGDSNYETMIDFNVGGNRFSSTQKVTAVETKSGTVSANALQTYCNRVLSSTTSTRAARALCTQLLPTLKGQPAQLGQGLVGIGLTETIYQDTDVSLSGTYDFYSQDPSTVGYFTLATAGRRTASMGEGVQIAPLRWSVRPDVNHRWGALSTELWFEHGKYVGDEGRSELVGVKLTYRFNKTYKAWITGTGQKDLDSSGHFNNSGTIGAGLKVYF